MPKKYHRMPRHSVNNYLILIHFLEITRQRVAPSPAITAHINIVPCQPSFSEKSANPYVDIALPTYVQELSIPEIKETLPYFLYIPGTIHTRIRLTPCIVPTTRAIRNTERNGVFIPKLPRSRAHTAQSPKISAEQTISFLKNLAQSF